MAKAKISYYLSNKELLSRHKFNWFINSSVDDLLTSEFVFLPYKYAAMACNASTSFLFVSSSP
mgnify:CR=1 FL=1